MKQWHRGPAGATLDCDLLNWRCFVASYVPGQARTQGVDGSVLAPDQLAAYLGPDGNAGDNTLFDPATYSLQCLKLTPWFNSGVGTWLAAGRANANANGGTGMLIGNGSGGNTNGWMMNFFGNTNITCRTGSTITSCTVPDITTSPVLVGTAFDATGHLVYCPLNGQTATDAIADVTPDVSVSIGMENNFAASVWGAPVRAVYYPWRMTQAEMQAELAQIRVA